MVKKILYILFIILVLQVVSYAIYAEKNIHLTLLKNQKFTESNSTYDIISFIFSKEREGITSPYHLKISEKNVYKKYYKTKYKVIETLDSYENIKKLLYREGLINYNIHFRFSSLGGCSVGEYISTYGNDDLNMEAWESKYVWVLFKWIKIKRECKGIS
jgi:hypothetical protein